LKKKKKTTPHETHTAQLALTAHRSAGAEHLKPINCSAPILAVRLCGQLTAFSHTVERNAIFLTDCQVADGFLVHRI
jgi:hypothetical protein